MKALYLMVGMGLCHLSAPCLAEEAGQAAPTFAGVFSDHAVLQRDRPVTVWGRSEAGARLSLSIDTQVVDVNADAAGHWQASLPARPAGGPYSLKIADAKTGTATTLNDIMLGDVYLCSGQSNMEMKVAYASNAWGELQGGVEPAIRYITIPRAVEASPLSEIKSPASWQVIGPQTRPDASATCYYMAKAIHAREKVAIGMIGSYWGGTVAQAWISEETLRTVKDYGPRLDILNAYGTSEPDGQTAWGAYLATRWQADEPDGKAKAAWARPGFDDKAWGTVSVATALEKAGRSDLNSFDGIIWLRTEVTLTRAEAAAASRLKLASIDDADITWVNGAFVGNSASWDATRNYALPKGLLKAGRNVVVVRVTDTGGGGGFRGKPSENAIVMADGAVKPLPEIWKYKISAPMSPAITPVNPPWEPHTGMEVLYNGMIAPISRYTIRAVAWYQGESNVYNPSEYAVLLPALMKDWRRSFKQPDLPFLIAQLAAYGPVAKAPGVSGWAELREAQRLTVDADPHAALAVTMDLGDRFDIHPTQKNIVGQRLARGARSIVYGDAATAPGPEAASVARDGSDLIVRFKGVSGALRTYSAAAATGFEVCDAQAACAYVTAVPEGAAMRLIAANRTGAVRVRYAWADAPYTNLYDDADVPVVPFGCEIDNPCAAKP